MSVRSSLNQLGRPAQFHAAELPATAPAHRIWPRELTRPFRLFARETLPISRLTPAILWRIIPPRSACFGSMDLPPTTPDKNPCFGFCSVPAS